MSNSQIKYAFFGTSRLSVIILEQLKNAGILPALIVTTPDKPQGRKLLLTPTPVKQWAIENGIQVFDPQKLDKDAVEHIRKFADDAGFSWDVFVVASYGKILPKELIEIPKAKTLNVHPSLLPLYRGASPLPSQILDDCKSTGVTIMRIDELMDHGPIVHQDKITIEKWPPYSDFEEMLAIIGGKSLAHILPKWIVGEIEEVEQDHSKATYTKKIVKEDAEIDLSANPYDIFRKIQAYATWPQAYFFIDHSGKKIRIKITEASFASGKLILEKVIPEGGKEMTFKDFESGYLFAKS